MTDFTQSTVSDFTEISDISVDEPLFAFARALGWGTLAGSAPAIVFIMLPIIALLIDGEGMDSSALYLMIIPLIVSGAITLAAMVVLGLPLTAFLKSRGKECPRIYALCGLAAGAIIPFAICLALGSWEAGLFFAIFGTPAGFATALSWGRWRASLRPVEPPQTTHENPFHDMIY